MSRCTMCQTRIDVDGCACDRAHRDAETARELLGDVEVGNAALRAELADLRNEVEILHSRIAYLESKGRR